MDNSQNIIIKTLEYEIQLINLTSNFKFDLFLNWIKNRTPDLARIDEIYNYYVDEKISLIPGTISVWKPYNSYHIYDGLHRFLAAKKAIDNNKLDNIQLILYINLTTDENKIINDFKNINKSIPLPYIYTDETENLIKKQICQNIVEELVNRFPDFNSPSRRPHRFNFNRDMLIEFISTFEINFNIKNLDKIIFKMLLLLNEKAKNDIKNSNFKCPSKCNKYGFYLFYLSQDYIKDQIEQKINELLNKN